MPVCRRRSPAPGASDEAGALAQDFYSRNPLVVARELLGKKIVRLYRGERLSGMIVEVEAYRGERDSASHAFRGLTARNAVMFGPAGHAYVYFVYGMYHCLNAVTGAQGRASAVLIRGVRPLEGLETMRRLRKGRIPLAEGPGRLCQALAIDRRFNGTNLTAGDSLWIENYASIRRGTILRGPRIGIAYARAADRNAHWRLYLRDYPNNGDSKP